MNENENLREPTWKEWLIMDSLSLCKDLSPTYKKKWAERIGTDPSNPTFTRALNLLKEAEALKLSPWIANCSIIEFNMKKLDKFIENSFPYKRFKQRVNYKEFFVVGV